MPWRIVPLIFSRAGLPRIDRTGLPSCTTVSVDSAMTWHALPLLRIDDGRATIVADRL